MSAAPRQRSQDLVRGRPPARLGRSDIVLRLAGTTSAALRSSGSASSAGTARTDRSVAEALTRRRAGYHRIGVLGLAPRVGTSTCALLLAVALASTGGREVLLCAGDQADDPATRCGLPHSGSADLVLRALRRGAAPPPTPRTASGVRVLCAESRLTVDELAGLLLAAEATHGATVLDLGTGLLGLVDGPGEGNTGTGASVESLEARALLGRLDALVVCVSRNSPVPAELICGLTADPDTCIVVRGPLGTGHPTEAPARWPATPPLGGGAALRTVGLPRDRALQAPGTLHLDRISGRTMQAVLGLAAHTLGAGAFRPRSAGR